MYNWTGKEQKCHSIDLFLFTLLSLSVTCPMNTVLTLESRYKTISEVEFYCCSQQRYIHTVISWGWSRVPVQALTVNAAKAVKNNLLLLTE
jgi:hypothetical protein